jgi:hypothetical protein
MTWVMFSTSMPRAATSVATRTSTLPSPELAQRLLAGALSEVAVDGGGGEAALDEVVGQFRCAARLVRVKIITSARGSACRTRDQHLGLVQGVRR